VRSWSLIENINSALRPLPETCGGQVEQEMLEMFAYVRHICRLLVPNDLKSSFHDARS
jgi:hypothetical protein